MIRKYFLKISRKIIPLIPRSRSFLINIIIKLTGGGQYNDFISTDAGRIYIERIDGTNRAIFFTGKYEKKETELVEKLVKEGDYAFDLGSNYGWYTVLMSRLAGNSGKVFSFELDKKIVDCLRITAAKSDNVIVENLGIGNTNGEIEYFYNDGSANLDASWYDNRKRLSSDEPLTEKKGYVVTLDSYIKENKISKVDFIKCDIDGAELKFIKGAKETLREFKPIILIEVQNENLDQFHQELDGYLFTKIGNNILCVSI